PEGRVRPFRHAVGVGHRVIDRVLPVPCDAHREGTAEDRDQDEQDDDDTAAERRLVLAQALPEEPPWRLAYDGNRLWEGDRPTRRQEFRWVRHPGGKTIP